MKKNINDYDYAIIIRPDTQLLNRFDVDYFNELNNNNIIIPQKNWYQGCNDRFSIGTPHIISYYGKLFDELKDYSMKKSIISERYLLDKLNENKITIISKDIDYNTLRINNNNQNNNYIIIIIIFIINFIILLTFKFLSL